jgi:hypothetical protein
VSHLVGHGVSDGGVGHSMSDDLAKGKREAGRKGGSVAD